jgi:hypothetical protein
MTTLSLAKGSLGIVLASVLAGCGGAETPPAKEPGSEQTEAAQAKQAKAEQPKDEEESKEAAPKKEASKSARKTPKDVVGDPELAFMFSFKDSELGAKKEEECAKKAKDDVEKKAACLSKAQAEVESHGIRFTKDDQDENWYIVFSRQGEKLTVLSRIKYTVGKEGSNQVTLNFTGRDMGKKPMGKVPSELVIEIVDDYTIAVNDPVKGRMVYRGKSGLFSDSSTKDR